MRKTTMRFTIVSMLCVFAAVVGGCGATVVPTGRVSEPVAVYVADYGVHSSLLLPTAEGRYVEYAFGDWGYAAENRCGPQDALGALTISFQSALGRRFFDVPPGETMPLPNNPPPRRMQRVLVERAAAEALVARLDERYAAAHEPPLKNPSNGIEFVKDVERYSVTNNCNHLTARSLKALGCEIRGLVVGSNFHVTDKVDPPVAAPPRVEADVPGWGPTARIG